MKSAERSTSRCRRAMLPGLRIGGPPCWSFQAASFCSTRPSSPNGSPLRSRVAAEISVARVAIGTIAGDKRIEELGQLRLQRAADGRHAERRERHQVAVEFAGPVDQPIAAGVGDQHVAAGTAEGAVLVAGCVSGSDCWQANRSCSRSAVVVVGIDQVVAEAAVDVVACRCRRPASRCRGRRRSGRCPRPSAW